MSKAEDTFFLIFFYAYNFTWIIEVDMTMESHI